MTQANFQITQPHPFVHALGNATVAARGYPGAVGVNPATIGCEGVIQAGSNLNLSDGPLFSSPWSVSRLWITAPSVSAKFGPWAGALQVKHFSLGEIELRNREGESHGEIESFEQSVKLAGARDLTDRFTVGVGVNFIRLKRAFLVSDVGTDAETLTTLDVGVHYEQRIEKESVRWTPAAGVSLTDFGPRISFENNPHKYGSPMTARIGGALEASSTSRWQQRPEWRVGLYSALSNVLVSGSFSGEEGQGTFTADGPFRALVSGWGSTYGQQIADGVARVGPWERLNKHVGMSLSVYDILSFRVGRYHEDDDNGARQYTALGFGLDAYYAALDVSLIPNEEERYQRLSYGRLTVRLPLGTDARNFWPSIIESVR